jgi:hypothetical protein
LRNPRVQPMSIAAEDEVTNVEGRHIVP